MSEASRVARLNAALEGHYHVERQLGEGGMATVYLARDERHNRNVALKVLKPELAAVVGAERFLAEIETTANLQHPHILPLFDSGEADGFLFYVMPYVEGESLRERLDREHQLPVDEAVRIASDVAEALDYAHSHGVIHRDIKPANILLHAGRPLIADFGIALAVSAGGAGRLTETGLSLGTPHYMSPEQATGDLSVGPATDIYSLGCVLYEMLAGDPPYTASTPQAILGKIVMDVPDPVTRRRRSVPTNVEAVVRKAMEKVPADRFSNGQELARALGDPAFRYGKDPQEAHAAGGGPWKRATFVLGALVVLLGAGLLARRAAPEPPPQRLRYSLDIPDEVAVPWQGGRNLDISVDGTKVVFIGSNGSSNVTVRDRRVYLRALDDLEARPLPNTEGAAEPRFSPDGRSVAFSNEEGIATLPLAGGAVTVVAPKPLVWSSASSGPGLEWGRDGLLYFTGVDGGLWRVSPDGGEPEQLTEPEGEVIAHRWPDVLPGGRALLFTLRAADPTQSRIAVLDLETGDIRDLVQGTMARYALSGHILYSPDLSGALVAAPFDLDELEVVGTGQTVLDGLRVLRNVGLAYFDVSDTDALMYRTESLPRTVPVWVDPDDGTEQVMSSNLRPGRYRDPAISPDGRRVAFEFAESGGSLEIWVYDMEGSGIRLTPEGDNLLPFWSPDGSKVGFSSTMGGPEPSIYTRPWDRSEPARMLRSAEAEGGGLFQGLWVPDQDRLVYRVASLSEASALLDASPVPDSAGRVIVDSPFDEVSPDLSSDGRWLAYVSNESGGYEVYVRSYAGPGGVLTVSRGGGSAPAWAPGDRELVYRGLDGTWYAATIVKEPALDVSSRRVLPFDRSLYVDGVSRNFDVAPDGRILAIRGSLGDVGNAVDVRYIVDTGFLDEVARLVPVD